MKRVCIVGLGFVGNAMYTSFKNKGINVYGYDKYKDGGIGKIDDILNSDIIFLALPTLYDEEKGEYDKTAIYECCDYLSYHKYEGIIIIKSTIEPETTDKLCDKYKKLKFIHNPEFLTARTAYEDFHNQTHIVLGQSKNCSLEDLEKVIKFYKEHYDKAEISTCSSIESESMKIFCNSFYAIKVQFFTELYMLTKTNNSNYEKILEMMLKNNWINPMHTQIPGPDGLISYGGCCFPKDTNALNKYMEKQNSPNEIISSCIKERDEMRNT